MSDGELIFLGRVTKTYGNNGEVSIKLSNLEFTDIKKKECVFIEINKKHVPFFIDSYSLKGKNLIVKFDDIIIDSRTNLLIDKNVFISRKNRKKTKKKFDYYDLIGFNLYDQYGENKGVIKNVDFYSSNIVLEVEYNKKQVLVPINNEIIIELNIKEGKIFLEIQEGLYEIYL